MNGSELIAAERQRQVDIEGWTSDHDATHRNGMLVEAAMSYAEVSSKQLYEVFRRGAERVEPDRFPRPDWPWDASWWKPSDDPLRNLVKAGALIAAEIDRLGLGEEGQKRVTALMLSIEDAVAEARRAHEQGPVE